MLKKLGMYFAFCRCTTDWACLGVIVTQHSCASTEDLEASRSAHDVIWVKYLDPVLSLDFEDLFGIVLHGAHPVDGYVSFNGFLTVCWFLFLGGCTVHISHAFV